MVETLCPLCYFSVIFVVKKIKKIKDKSLKIKGDFTNMVTTQYPIPSDPVPKTGRTYGA
jgi:hypothetical protein